MSVSASHECICCRSISKWQENKCISIYLKTQNAKWTKKDLQRLKRLIIGAVNKQQFTSLQKPSESEINFLTPHPTSNLPEASGKSKGSIKQLTKAYISLKQSSKRKRDYNMSDVVMIMESRRLKLLNLSDLWLRWHKISLIWTPTLEFA